MLENPRQQALADFREFVAVQVRGGDGAFGVAVNLAENPRQRQAAFFKGRHLAFRLNGWVDVHFGVFFGAVNGGHENPQIHPRLRPGQPDALGLDHNLHHPLGQHANALVDCLNRLSPLNQHRRRIPRNRAF